MQPSRSVRLSTGLMRQKMPGRRLVFTRCNFSGPGSIVAVGVPNSERARMPIEREVVRETITPVTRETIVTDDGSTRAVGSGLWLGIAVVIIVMLLVGGFTVFNGGFSFGGKSVTLDVPKVTVSK